MTSSVLALIHLSSDSIVSVPTFLASGIKGSPNTPTCFGITMTTFSHLVMFHRTFFSNPLSWRISGFPLPCRPDEQHPTCFLCLSCPPQYPL